MAGPRYAPPSRTTTPTVEVRMGWAIREKVSREVVSVIEIDYLRCFRHSHGGTGCGEVALPRKERTLRLRTALGQKMNKKTGTF